MKVTIKEIAKMAGVHRSTVDKVLHNRVGVSDEVRQRIQSLIDQLEYTPNPAGRALQKQGKVYCVAVVLVQVDALPYLREGVEAEREQEKNFDIVTEYHITAFQDIQGQRDVLRSLIEKQVDGIVISPINADCIRQEINRATDAGIPVITINSDLQDSARLCYVGQNGAQTARIAGRLLGQFMGGSGQTAIITNSISSENNDYYVRIREQGFSEFMAENYPEIHIIERIESFEDKEITYRKTRALLRQNPQLQGIYITCGGVAEVGRALQDEGRAQQIKVLSFEDYPEILALMKDGVIDCTLGSDLLMQGKTGLRLMIQYLVYGIKPELPEQFTEVKILIRESIYA